MNMFYFVVLALLLTPSLFCSQKIDDTEMVSLHNSDDLDQFSGQLVAYIVNGNPENTIIDSQGYTLHPISRIRYGYISSQTYDWENEICYQLNPLLKRNEPNIVYHLTNDQINTNSLRMHLATTEEMIIILTALDNDYAKFAEDSSRLHTDIDLMVTILLYGV